MMQEEREIIFDYIKKYFSIENDSLEEIKEELFNPTIEPYLYNKMNENLRITFELQKNAATDEAFQLFITKFPFFLQNNPIGYQNFLENKISLGKNKRKLQSFLINFYINHKAKFISYFATDNELLRFFDTINIVYILKKFDGEQQKVIVSKIIRERLNAVNNKRTKKIYCVISKNPVDLFLCSTGENWTSCLNLFSDYSGAFWSDIPSLYLDKNRYVVYLTNFEEKEILGLKSYKTIARAFALNSEEDNLHLFRWYPEDKTSIENIKESFYNIFSEELPMKKNNDGFVSKYPVNWMRLKNGIKTFAFHDYIIRNREKKFVSNLFDKGRFFLDSSNDLKSGCFINVELPEGLQTLIDRNTEILDENISYDKITCDSCGESYLMTEEGERIFYSEVQDRYFCENCEIGNINYCEDCGEEIPLGENLCFRCSENHAELRI